jgi:tRNA G46 methylase TrmB
LKLEARETAEKVKMQFPAPWKKEVEGHFGKYGKT